MIQILWLEWRAASYMLFSVNPPKDQRPSVVVIGAGPAGLTASYLLSQKDFSVTVLEADPDYVGGISRTVCYKGYRFDIGGHRFFSKSQAVEDLWTELLGQDLLHRPRSSRIYYRGRFFSYPLKAGEALLKLGLKESFLCVMSYLRARMKPVKNPKTFEDWISNQFGKRLFRIFFKTYTEKVWGMSCEKISADWAAQRIKGLSLSSAIRSALLPLWFRRRHSGPVIKTLIESFRYPRLGPGMMWEEAARRTKKNGGEIRMGCRANRLAYDTSSQKWRIYYATKGGEYVTEADHVISSAPLRDIVKGLSPTPKSVALAEKLKYRDFLTVALIVRGHGLFDDNWIYIHEPSVKVGRVQNFKSWSPELIPLEKRETTTCYGLEYFCFEGDGLWNAKDDELIDLAKKELNILSLSGAKDVIDGCVVRQKKAYPVYDDHYAEFIDQIRYELQEYYPGLHVVGRNGMHKYNNQDHAMMTAMLTVQNIVAGRAVYNVWAVNQDAEYHESGLRSVPHPVDAAVK